MQDNHLAVHYKSSIEVMNAGTNFSASETLNMIRSLAMFLRWKNAVL